MEMEEDRIPPELIKSEIKKEGEDVHVKSEVYDLSYETEFHNKELFTKHTQHSNSMITRDMNKDHISLQSALSEPNSKLNHIFVWAEETHDQLNSFKDSCSPSTDKPSQAGIKLYKCSECSYSSRYKTNVNSHQRIHTGEKPYKCSECSFSTCHKHNLVPHQRIHTGEKPYKCTICSFSTCYKPNIVRHQRIHTGEKPHKCPECPYMTLYKPNLVRHQRTHTGEKPFNCSECSYSTAQKSHLVRHQRTHTKEGDKPYKCSGCPYRANLRENFYSHKQTHLTQTIPSGQRTDTSISAQIGSNEEPIFVKPLPFVKPITFVKPLFLAEPLSSSSNQSSGYLPALSHTTQSRVPPTFSSMDSVFIPSSTYSTAYPPPLISPVSTPTRVSNVYWLDTQ